LLPVLVGLLVHGGDFDKMKDNKYDKLFRILDELTVETERLREADKKNDAVCSKCFVAYNNMSSFVCTAPDCPIFPKNIF
jgi:hypothetical protein